jgi:uncharacterized protein YqgC (DUF456 family)
MPRTSSVMPYPPAMDTHLILYILAGVLILAGLAGTILPALPGLPLMFIGMLIAAWADDFQQIGGWTIAILAVLTLISIAVDIAATAMGAKRVGASKTAMFGAALGTLIGGILFNIPGLIIGPFLGAMAGELIQGREWMHASRIGFGTWVGLAVGTALKLAMAFAMLGVFVLAVLWK